MPIDLALFDIIDGLLDEQSELSSPPDSSDDEQSDEYTEDEEDEWYNLPSDSDSKDDIPIASALLIRPTPLTSTNFVISLATRKEYLTSTRIKVIYMLKDKKSLSIIKITIGVIKSVIYYIIVIAKEYK